MVALFLLRRLSEIGLRAILLLGCALLATNCGSDESASTPSTEAFAICGQARTSCAGACVELEVDLNNCGACGNQCSSAEVCHDGECTVPELTRCTGVECNEAAACDGGTCECPAGTLCLGRCVELEQDVEHCGACGRSCAQGEECVLGSCRCAPSKVACVDSCTDVTTDPRHCGTCSNACPSGDRCVAGECVSQDGCFGLAHDLQLSEVSVYQSLKIPLVREGKPIAIAERNAEVVEGRAAVFRLFVRPAQGWQPRELSGRVRLSSSAQGEQEFFDKVTLTSASNDEDPQTTFNIQVPASAIRADTRVRVEIADCAESSAGTALNTSFSSAAVVSADFALQARRTGSLKLRLIPFTVMGITPDVSARALNTYRDLMEAMYPITQLELSLGEPIIADPKIDWNAWIEQVRQRRAEEAEADDVYYYGLVKPAPNFDEFCDNTCTAGIGYVTSFTSPSLRVAVGIGFADELSALTMAHEVGHNHGRDHAPCGAEAKLDEDYPYERAALGVWGYDRRSGALLDPSHPDIMGYCDEPWISDYTYQGLMDRVLALNHPVAQFAVGGGQAITWRVLLVEGETARWSFPYQGEAPTAEIAKAAILDAGRQVIASIDVRRIGLYHSDSSLLLIPEPQAGWVYIQLPGLEPKAFAEPVAIPSP